MLVRGTCSGYEFSYFSVIIIVSVQHFLWILPQRRVFMGMTKDGLSYWQADTGGIDLLDTTLGDLLDSRADEIPGREAVVYSCYPEFGGALDIRWNYAEYRARVDAVARGLMALGLQKGDHIAVWAANLP